MTHLSVYDMLEPDGVTFTPEHGWRYRGVTHLEQLLAEHDALYRAWLADKGDEELRAAALATWDIGITQPGSTLGGRDEPFQLLPEDGCQPTVLSANRDDSDGLGHLMFRGACLGCGWVSGRVHPLRAGGGNAAVEDAHDHTHPGWRDLPVVPPAPRDVSGSQAKAALDRKRAEIAALHPPGWAERRGPTRTLRQPMGTRHVPFGGWFGGYDLSAGQMGRLED